MKAKRIFNDITYDEGGVPKLHTSCTADDIEQATTEIKDMEAKLEAKGEAIKAALGFLENYVGYEDEVIQALKEAL